MNDDITIVDGLYEIDEKYISKRPPKIKWGVKYKGWESDRKIEYLEKLVNSLNHSVSLIQDERNELNRLVILKEKQLTEMASQLRANHDMLHEEITRMNADRNAFRETISKLDQEIRNGNNS